MKYDTGLGDRENGGAMKYEFLFRGRRGSIGFYVDLVEDNGETIVYDCDICSFGCGWRDKETLKEVKRIVLEVVNREIKRCFGYKEIKMITYGSYLVSELEENV